MARYCIAHLKADPGDLQFLREVLRSPDLCITKTAHGEALFVRFERQSLSTTDAWNEAEAIRRALVGALNAFVNSLPTIEIIAPVSAVDERGRGETVAATLGMHLRITSKEGRLRLLQPTADGLESMMSRVVRIASTYPEVARALSLLCDHDPSWSDIYLLMEIVELNLRRNSAHVGKDWVAIIAQQWLPASVVKAVKRNAGYHRHAKQFAEPQPRLSLPDAQVRCKIVVSRWLEKLTTG